MTDIDPTEIFLEWTLEPFKNMVKSGVIEPELIAPYIAHCLGNFEFEKSPEFAKFEEMLEIDDSDYVEVNAGGLITNYRHHPASKTLPPYLFHLHNQTGKEFGNPAELKSQLEEMLEGKKILELGSGPGYDARGLQDFGAEVVAMDTTVYDHEAVKVTHGDVSNLHHFVNTDFDLVYSKDFFCTVMIEGKRAQKALSEACEVTKKGGQHYHAMTYVKMHPAVLEMERWAQENYGNRFGMLQPLKGFELECSRWTNDSSCDPQMFLRKGMELTGYNIERGELVITARK